MKKVISSILVVMLLFAGCSTVSKNSNSIEKYNWELDIVQNSASMVIASSEKSSFNNPNVMEMTAKAKNGDLVIKDLTNGKDYIINYTEVEVNEDSTIYKISDGVNEGNAVVSKTKNGKYRTPTLYMTLNGKSLKFFGN